MCWEKVRASSRAGASEQETNPMRDASLMQKMRGGDLSVFMERVAKQNN